MGVELHEIRCGNWFVGFDDKPFEWVVGHFGLLCVSVNAPMLDELIKEPIPLTEDVLNDLRFIQTDETLDNHSFDRWELGSFRIWFSNYLPHSVWINVDNDNNDGKYRLQPEYKNLHQLQNLYFSLTNTELNYTP